MQMLAPRSNVLPGLFADRSAFVLNANARAVSDRVAKDLAEVVPEGDLFFSRSLDDAERIADLITRRGYRRVFTGGGDGTLVSTLNLLEKACKRHGVAMPEVGVLKLGTGNAVAGLLSAGRPKTDAAHIANGGSAETRKIHMVRTDDGALTPFAGMGYDGEILNDYYAMKEQVAEKAPFLKALLVSVFGYLVAMLARTVPRYARGKKATRVRITSAHDAVKVVHRDGIDEDVVIPAGEVLYEGPAPVLSVGTVPFFGGGFTMFPFAFRRENMMQLRVCAVSIPRILANLFPRVWNGSFRHPDLHDFLVQDVQVVADEALDYQVGGDAAGQRQSLSFTMTEQPIEMVVLGERLAPPRERLRQGLRRLLPA